ncbi:hypothetical protein MOQ26_07945 [Stenotrophomonas maltophilia]|nr:hypothetical protein [Stenotrophomonas maltophilia]
MEKEDESAGSSAANSGGVSHAPVVDGVLKRLVRLANLGGGFSVTLLVDGMLVSGTLIAGREYFSHITDGLRASSSPEAVKSVMIQLFEQMASEYQEMLDQPGGYDPRFIHLKDAAFFVPGGGPPILKKDGGTHWRGSLASVSGFYFGLTTAS